MGSAGCSGRPGVGPSSARTPRGEGPAGRRSGRQRLDPSVGPDPRAPGTPAREPRVSEAGAQRGCARTCGAELSEEGNRALGQGTATHLLPRLSRGGGGAGTARKSVKGCAAGGSGRGAPRLQAAAACHRRPGSRPAGSSAGTTTSPGPGAPAPRRALGGGAGRQREASAVGARGEARASAVLPGSLPPAGTERGCGRGRFGAALPTHSSRKNESFFLLKREK